MSEIKKLLKSIIIELCGIKTISEEWLIEKSIEYNWTNYEFSNICNLLSEINIEITDDKSNNSKTSYNNIQIDSLENESINYYECNEDNEYYEKVDFNNRNINLSFTNPIKMIFNNGIFFENTWASLYYKFINLLYCDQRYREKIIMISNMQKRTDIGNYQKSLKMRRPVHIVDDIYLESNMNSKDKFLQIRRFMKDCGISYDEVIIYYQKK